ncbi:type III-A CRISPR-associated protein Cas10/Csm1 [Parabacteroides sp. OttesenSCG-928-N08]|nr:type III-A CRISPR-associated protein Cas10/Csm1 [Parabacteroides sp. OttesenSCG-928-N08]
MSNSTLREQIYLSALLHDMKKLYQHSDIAGVGNSVFLKNSLSTDNLLDEEQQSVLSRIIKEADCLSLGMDSLSDDPCKEDRKTEKQNDSLKERMNSIMPTIQRTNTTKKYYLPVEALSLSKSTFPRQEFDTAPDYASLCRKFNDEFALLKTTDSFSVFSETLLNLLFKYTTSIPANSVNNTDVSLYDHLKTTAAIALCLYDVEQDKETVENPFLLIGGDLSGIQSYIYQIVSQYASKNLKGRSFYLRILSDTIVRFLLKELDLFRANVVYNSGGSFYLLAPNCEKTRTKLAAAIDRIERQLFITHGISLFMAIDSVEVAKDAFLQKNGLHLGKVWGELFSKRDKKKTAKFPSLITERYEQFFTPSITDAGVACDSITGEAFQVGEKKFKDDYKGKELHLKRTTKEQIDLGTALRSSEVMIVSEGKVSCLKDKISVEPAALGFFYYFLNYADLKLKGIELSSYGEKITVVTLNGKEGDCCFMGDLPDVNNIYGLEFYGGNEFNENTFSEMCEGKGFSRLGVLRMDVDNLGAIFQSGISPERATLSRYAALSRSFDYFFSGYLNTIWKEIAPDRSFIVYSGGDDVFIVGSWDETIRIAKRIRSDFREYTCNNPAFSISGGVAIVTAKFPIIKGAEYSAEEEQKAKNHRCCEHEKNALSFMSMPLNWDLEFPVVEKLKETIVTLINTKKMSKSFISKVLSHAANAKIEQHKITILKTYWMMTYDLSRLREREKNTEVIRLIDTCKSDLYGDGRSLNGEPIKTNYHPLELWAFACRWAELENRANSN